MMTQSLSHSEPFDLVHLIRGAIPPHLLSQLRELPPVPHHDDGHGNGGHQHKKPNLLPMVADLLWQSVRNLNLCAHRPVAVDPWMKLYKLPAGKGAVPPHTDEDYGTDQRMALYSMIVYLNDDYTGGETVFVGSHEEEHHKAGDALLFPHALLHEASDVISGVKYVLKTDLFVRPWKNY